MNAVRRRPELIVWAMMAAFSAVFAYLAVARQRAFWTGRFDLGNMVQAVWSTAHGRPLETTNATGDQFVRLGAHVDPVLVLFTPLAWTGSLPEALLVAQVLIVASGALPAYWLGRRRLPGTRLAGAALPRAPPPAAPPTLLRLCLCARATRRRPRRRPRHRSGRRRRRSGGQRGPRRQRRRRRLLRWRGRRRGRSQVYRAQRKS